MKKLKDILLYSFSFIAVISCVASFATLSFLKEKENSNLALETLASRDEIIFNKDLELVKKDQEINALQESYAEAKLLIAMQDQAGYKIEVSQLSKILETAKVAARKYKLDYTLILAVLGQESDFHPSASSRTSFGRIDAGLCQMSPDTFEMYNKANNTNYPASKRYDIEIAVDAAAWYLSYLKENYPYIDTEEKMLTAYNRGPHNLQKDGIINEYPEKVFEIQNCFNVAMNIH